ncbi:MAG: hypothetical protein J6M03_06805, partial [Clostridia bacterium]|nr:hypothetical protein [Clostridia bacterium]
MKRGEKPNVVGDDILGVPSKTQRNFINEGRIISSPTDKISKFSPNSVGTGVPDGPRAIRESP